MITIVGADWCPACRNVKKLVQQHNIEYKYVTIPEGRAGWDMVETLTGKRSIPQVFYHFGGSKDFREALNSVGELIQ